jgi:hypothetical protein
MKITVRVHPKSAKNKVIRHPEGDFEVYTNAPPQKNKANQALVGLLAGYFDLPKSSISILAGYKNKSKIVEILQ